MYVQYGGAGAVPKSVVSLPDSCGRDGPSMSDIEEQGEGCRFDKTTVLIVSPSVPFSLRDHGGHSQTFRPSLLLLHTTRHIQSYLASAGAQLLKAL